MVIETLTNESITLSNPLLNTIAQLIIPPLKTLYFLVGGLIGIYVLSLLFRILYFTKITRNIRKQKKQLNEMQDTLHLLKKDIKEIKKIIKTRKKR